jgi:hypothetical protein
MLILQWLKQIAEIQSNYPDAVEACAAATAADCSYGTDSGVADFAEEVTNADVSAVPAEDIESPWYYENIGFHDRGRVSDFALSGCCWD